MNTIRDRPVLMLSTIHSSHSGRSGYGLLAQYVKGAEFLNARRADPGGGASLFFARVARKFAFSRWYLGGSAELEWKAVHRLHAGFEGVVHSMWADHDLGYLDFFLNKKRQKFCGTFHNCPDDFQHTIRFPSRLGKFDAVILMSECQRPFFCNAGVPDEKIHVVLHGVDTEYFVPRRETTGDSIFTVISVGGFRRNFPLLRKVCNMVSDVKNIRFKIIAPTAWRTMFSNVPNADFFSGVNDNELLASYQSASCLLHTAEHATANNAMLEAMACGVPIIAERIGGIPEYATTESSLLADQGDEVALAGAIRKLAQSPALRDSMGAAARKRAETLAWPKVAERMTQIYQAL